MLKYFANNAGFTLFEVMIALAVFALASSMLLLSGGNSIKHTGYLQEKVIAVHMADQYLNKIYAEQRYPDQGVRGRSMRYAGYSWYLRETVSDMPNIGLRKVVVDIFFGASPADVAHCRASVTAHLRAPKK